jgi:hypothetical protein
VAVPSRRLRHGVDNGGLGNLPYLFCSSAKPDRSDVTCKLDTPHSVR